MGEMNHDEAKAMKLKTSPEWRQVAKQNHYPDEQVPHHNLVSAIDDIETLLAERDRLREAIDLIRIAQTQTIYDKAKEFLERIEE